MKQGVRKSKGVRCTAVLRGVCGLLVVWCGLGRAFAHVGVLGPDRNPEIRIIADLTPEGRKLPTPSRERPVIYFPVLSDDPPEHGRDVPAAAEVHRWLRDALAQNGYICVSPENDQPTQLLVFQWGEILPENETEVWWNKGEMMDLVVGKAGQARAWWEHMALIGEASSARFFVRVMAYDYAAAKRKERVLLWHARISAHTDGLTMAGIMPTLIKLGGPYFGREQSRPLVQFVPLEKPGRVELGEAEVIEYLPSKTDRDAKGAAPKK